MAFDNNRRFESVFSKKIRAGKRRTYFFDVRQTKGNDYYLTLTESTKRFDGDGYSRHKIFLYKEDFNRFMEGLQEAVDYVKTDLMPDYDYDEFTRRHEEYERNKALELENEANNPTEEGDDTVITPEETETEETETTIEIEDTAAVDNTTDDDEDDDEDLSW